MNEESSQFEGRIVTVIIQGRRSINVPNLELNNIEEVSNLILNHLETINQIDLDFINFISREVNERDVMNEEDFQNLEKTDSENNCPICFLDTKDNIILNCKHVFCESCIKEWLIKNKNNCPICRK
jgi:pyruvate formate-lyase activating enzyme-like uncharacterized protein